MPDSPPVDLEIILVVDDIPLVLGMVAMILKRAKFDVLTAGSGLDAIRLAGETVGRIDLLLSDVDMEQMSGPDLSRELKKTRPNVRVMLMSAGDGVKGNLLVPNCGWAFIEKPFVAAKLVEMINSVLHTPDRSQPGGKEFESDKDVNGEGQLKYSKPKRT